MPRVKGDKYNRKYCKQLTRGLRADGLSIEEVCQMWGICRSTYNYWVDTHPEFATAHEFGKRDFVAYWHKLTRQVAAGEKKGNAGVLCFSMKNAEGVGWKDKVEVDNVSDEQIKQINISILPAPIHGLVHGLPSNLQIIDHVAVEDPDGS